MARTITSGRDVGLSFNGTYISSRYTYYTDAQYPAIPVERPPRPSPGAVAQPLSALANRDLYRHQDAEHRLPGVLWISVARAQRAGALLAMDRRDGALRPCQAEKPVS